MTLRQFLDYVDVTRPNAWSRSQKTAWVNDLEAMVWTQIFLCPPGLWRPYSIETDGGARLLLPDSWRRVYDAYLDARIDLANGEYTQYENSMAQYNSAAAELGAWYADAFDPARQPPRWAALQGAAYTELAGGTVGVLPGQAALLAVEAVADEAFSYAGECTLWAGGAPLARIPVGPETADTTRSLGLIPPTGRDESVTLRYAGRSQSAGHLSLRVLLQPPAARGSAFG